MYLPTRSASGFILALTKLWTLKPLCRQERILSPHSGLISSFPTRNIRTSRAKILASRFNGQSIPAGTISVAFSEND